MTRPSFDEYFGYMVQVIKLRSDDEETQVGSVIVNSENVIVSTGYNGTPRGTNLPHKRPDKYPYMTHSEINAVITAHKDLKGCKIYIYGMAVCCDCARVICQVGIKEIIVVNKVERKEGKDWDNESSKEMFRQCGVKVRYIRVPELKTEKFNKFISKPIALSKFSDPTPPEPKSQGGHRNARPSTPSPKAPGNRKPLSKRSPVPRTSKTAIKKYPKKKIIIKRRKDLNVQN